MSAADEETVSRAAYDILKQQFDNQYASFDSNVLERENKTRGSVQNTFRCHCCAILLLFCVPVMAVFTLLSAPFEDARFNRMLEVTGWHDNLDRALVYIWWSMVTSVLLLMMNFISIWRFRPREMK
jgi:uncharacterized BrkB/YihY/UPF0761 family membrane protein